MSNRLMKNILELLEAEQASRGSNNGTLNSFNNHGGGNQNFSNAKINSGAYAGDRNRYNSSKHYGERVINNSGTFNGNGNGGYIEVMPKPYYLVMVVVNVIKTSDVAVYFSV
ncbi:unnamed protein product [Sphenostylis stenocarpa]|uniref:Uncharacterized protein n=1 Tax=Sphenostylis stenocarpa TaxID=92480 RepID=A0AA86SSG9_9FABA|nr:unnamed protein product [Sphenostylis stenocarpa]